VKSGAEIQSEVVKMRAAGILEDVIRHAREPAAGLTAQAKWRRG
jgi:hypothetical protein